jgi:hypothetical protein
MDNKIEELVIFVERLTHFINLWTVYTDSLTDKYVPTVGARDFSIHEECTPHCRAGRALALAITAPGAKKCAEPRCWLGRERDSLVGGLAGAQAGVRALALAKWFRTLRMPWAGSLSGWARAITATECQRRGPASHSPVLLSELYAGPPFTTFCGRVCDCGHLGFGCLGLVIFSFTHTEGFSHKRRRRVFCT